MPQILVWKPWRIVSSAHAPRAGSPTASRLPASHCRRVNSTRSLVMTFLPDGDCGLFRAVAPRPSFPGLTRQSILLLIKSFTKKMDARVKPAHDGLEGAHPSLLLLQVKFADARRHVVERLRDHLLEFVRRRRHRDGAGLLDQRAVIGGADDRGDLAL